MREHCRPLPLAERQKQISETIPGLINAYPKWQENIGWNAVPQLQEHVLTGVAHALAANNPNELDQVVRDTLRANPIPEKPNKKMSDIARGLQLSLDSLGRTYQQSDLEQPFAMQQRVVASVLAQHSLAIAGQTDPLIEQNFPQWMVRTRILTVALVKLVSESSSLERTFARIDHVLGGSK